MSPTTVTDLLDSLRELHLLEPAQLEAAAKQRTRFGDLQGLAKAMVSKGWLTTFQVNHLVRGRGGDLLVGPYVLLDRLGGGGMGEVFKARNWKTGLVVALKLIRKDKLANLNAIRRFQREVQASAQLAHPHIVRAIDADQAGQTFYYAMEFVDGQDLAQQVKKQGPLPVELACEYVRQAALGLQHAHEHGLVHRDIKPANLLVSRDRQIKILDLGLARMDQSGDGESLDTLTQEGSVVGTLDYLAPEQALNSHQVDIRADLYGLGCTFFFLLTGKAPFPGGTAAEKLMKHRLEAAPAVEQLRPETPAWMARVVRKLMAKKPEDRYQTPKELALVLQTQAPPPSATDRLRGVGHGLRSAWSWCRRHPRLAGGAVGLALVGLMVFWSVGGGPVASNDAGANETGPPAGNSIHPVLGYELKPHPPQGVPFGGHWYAFYPEPVTPWQEAQRRCQEQGGYLACIQTPEEYEFLRNLPKGRLAWLGGYSNEKGKWLWLTGEPFPFEKPRWLAGTLNNGANSYLQFYKGENPVLHDIGTKELDRWPAGYICEWEF